MAVSPEVRRELPAEEPAAVDSAAAGSTVIATGVAAVADGFEEEIEDGPGVLADELGSVIEDVEDAVEDAVEDGPVVDVLAGDSAGDSADEAGDAAGSEILGYCRSAGQAAEAEPAGRVETGWVESVAASTEYVVSAGPVGVQAGEPAGLAEPAGSWLAGDMPSKGKDPAEAASVAADHPVNVDAGAGGLPEPRLGHAEQSEAGRVSSCHSVGWVCSRC